METAKPLRDPLARNGVACADEKRAGMRLCDPDLSSVDVLHSPGSKVILLDAKRQRVCEW
jgi:hypothetical protein